MSYTVEKLDDFGRGIINVDNKICFVKNALPTEEININITKEKKKYLEANVASYLKESHNRIAAKCKYYGICGGCQLEHMKIEDENQYKKRKVEDILEKFASQKIKIAKINSGREYNYRNKITLHVQEGKLCLLKEDSNDYVEIDKCLLVDEKINVVISKLKALVTLEKGIKTIMIRIGNYTDQIMIDISGQVNNENVFLPLADSVIINNKSINTRRLWIGGHSKGGNLAVFAAMHVDKEVQDVIIKVFNFDGPGFNHKMIYTAGYKRIFDRIETFLPQSSIVGLLLEHVDDYVVVRSRNSGPLQHDAFSWEIMGGSIIKADGLDKNSVRLDKTLRNWIGSMDEAQRKQFVNVLFSIASDSNFENLDQMSFKQLIEMIKAADELSKADWSMLKDTVRLLISAGVGVVRDEKEK